MSSRDLSKKIMRRIAGVLPVAARQISFDTIRSPKLEVFVDIAGGIVEKCKTGYLKRLPNIFDGISKGFPEETDKVAVG